MCDCNRKTELHLSSATRHVTAMHESWRHAALSKLAARARIHLMAAILRIPIQIATACEGTLERELALSEPTHAVNGGA